MEDNTDINDVYKSLEEMVPDWNTFDHPTAFLTQLPSTLPHALWELLDQYIHHNSEYKYVCTVLASVLDIPVTTAMGRDPLLKELKELFAQLDAAKFDRALDGFGALALAYCYGDRLEEMNSIFAECKLGYKLVNDTLNKLHWELAVKPTTKSPTIKRQGSNQGASLLETCVYSLKMTSSARDKLYAKADGTHYIQEALGDCITAVGLLLGLLSGEMDIQRAKTKLERQECAGINTVIGDGLFIWTHLERCYKSLANNLPTNSTVSEDEVFYWSDRIDAFIAFFQKRL